MKGKIKRAVKVIREVLGKDVVSIILFGSGARGDLSKWSDLDFLVVTKKKCEERKKIDILKELNFPANILMKTKHELLHHIKGASALYLDIVEDGKAVYGEGLSEYNSALLEIKRLYKLERNPELGKGVWKIGLES